MYCYWKKLEISGHVSIGQNFLYTFLHLNLDKFRINKGKCIGNYVLFCTMGVLENTICLRKYVQKKVFPGIGNLNFHPEGEKMYLKISAVSTKKSLV